MSLINQIINEELCVAFEKHSVTDIKCTSGFEKKALVHF